MGQTGDTAALTLSGDRGDFSRAPGKKKCILNVFRTLLFFLSIITDYFTEYLGGLLASHSAKNSISNPVNKENILLCPISYILTSTISHLTLDSLEIVLLTFNATFSITGSSPVVKPQWLLHSNKCIGEFTSTCIFNRVISVRTNQTHNSSACHQ